MVDKEEVLSILEEELETLRVEARKTIESSHILMVAHSVGVLQRIIGRINETR